METPSLSLFPGWQEAGMRMCVGWGELIQGVLTGGGER